MDPDSRNRCIPQEICIQILSYLPVKSLLRFRSTSKGWKSMIDSPDFTSLHLRNYSNNIKESHLLILERDRLTSELRAHVFNSLNTTHYDPQTLEYDTAGEEEPFCLRHLTHVPRISGDCHGLHLVERNQRRWDMGDIMLWNPSIRKTYNIPPPPTPTPTSSSTLPDLCLGFDPSTNDYKVANILSYHDNGITCEIFSLKTQIWRSGNTPPPDGDDNLRPALSGSLSKKVNSEGYVHWVAYGDIGTGIDYIYDKAFISFNMTTETISSAVPLPVRHSLLELRTETAVVLSGGMAGVLTTTGFEVDTVWVLGRNGRWSKLCTMAGKLYFRMGGAVARFFHLKKDGVLIHGQVDLADGRGALFSFDTKTETKTVVSESFQVWPFYMGTFVESLVLLK